MTETYISHSHDDTERLGEEFGKQLVPGNVVAFYGNLGAGKTAFCRGAIKGAGHAGLVTSPTFAIVNEYRGGRVDVAHFDMYRISSEDELYSTGFYDYLDSGFAILIEWAKNIDAFLDPDFTTICIKGSGDEQREITIADGRDAL